MFRNILLPLIVLITLLGACQPEPQGTTAAPPATAASAGLPEAIAAFGTAVRRNDHKSVIAAMPDRILPAMARNAGLPESEMRLMLITLLTQLNAGAAIKSFYMDLSHAKQGQTSTGQPFFLIPTVTELAASGAAMQRSQSTTLAFKEAGRWRLVRLASDQQRAQLISAYPEFRGRI